MLKFQSNSKLPNARGASQIHNKRSNPKTIQKTNAAVFQTNYQMLTDKSNSVNQTKRIGSNDLQQRQSNSGNKLQKSPTNEDLNFQNDKFQAIEQTSNDLNEVFKHQIDLQISNTKFKF